MAALKSLSDNSNISVISVLESIVCLHSVWDLLSSCISDFLEMSRNLDIFLLYYETEPYLNLLVWFPQVSFWTPLQRLKVGCITLLLTGGGRIQIAQLSSMVSEVGGSSLLLCRSSRSGSYAVSTDIEVGVASSPLAILKLPGLTLHRASSDSTPVGKRRDTWSPLGERKNLGPPCGLH